MKQMRALAEAWIRRNLGESPSASEDLTQGFPITYLSAESALNDVLTSRKPVLFPGHPQFERHINVTRGRG